MNMADFQTWVLSYPI
ncbi:BH3083 [Halalkalibacterium halodurans C-125]|uniref:BH3083 protein n=1 Tax=Halalkalibacterium halodurans (strain ATCC BAA-125 / DSM 18197 / FERM 7344 / JCM 9153 / C-125) TaxID=272558 RepID=Q9K8C3_HALH5|nr:BH3083 [Halalkalibacterium halodurans C-125]